jgi:hypothetical protein
LIWAAVSFISKAGAVLTGRYIIMFYKLCHYTVLLREI